MKDRKRGRENEHDDDKPPKKQASGDCFHTAFFDHVDDVHSSLSRKGGDSPRTPRRPTSEITRGEETEPSSINSKSGGQGVQNYGNAAANRVGEVSTFEGGAGVNVSVDSSDGEYVLKIKRRKISSSTDEEKRDQMAQTAGKLLLHAEILRGMGEQLLAQYRASLRSIFI